MTLDDPDVVRDVLGGTVFASRDALVGYRSRFGVLHKRDETERADRLTLPLRVTCRNVVFVADEASA